MSKLDFSKFPWRCLRAFVILLLSILAIFSTLLIYQAIESGDTELELGRPQSFILTNVHVLTMDSDEVLHNYAITVENGKISKLSPMNQPFSSDLPILDGEQQYVMPGLIDMHVHLLDRSYAKSALAAGVTTVRNMGGFPYHLKWKNEIEEGHWFGSRMIVSSPIFNSIQQGDVLSQFRVNEPAVARQAVRDYIEEGYDFIKVYEGLSAEVYAAVLDEAKKLEVGVAGHPSYDLLSENPGGHKGLQTFEHTEEIYDGFLNREFNDEKAISAASFLKKYDMTLVPTLAVNRELTRLSNEKDSFLSLTDQEAINPFARYVYQQTSYKRWLEASPELMAYNLKADNYFHSLTRLMHDQGVTIVLGSDAGALVGLPGPATHDEIELMAEAGIPAYEVLRSATVNAAAALGRNTEFGRIAPGLYADFIVLANNPMDDLDTLRNPQMVVQQGRIFNSEDLQQLRIEAHQHSSWLLSIMRQLHFVLFG